MSDDRHQPTGRTMDREISPLIGAVPVEGPPVILVAAPWLLLALVLAGPFALLITIVVAMLAAVLVIAALAAIVASPYLLVRHLRAVEARRAAAREHTEPENPPTVAGRHPSPTSVSLPGY
jgi:hypothetical protein